MDNEPPLVDNVFNGQRFQKFSSTDLETGDTIFIFCVDGLRISREEWTRMREAAIAADLRRFLVKE